MRVIKISGHQLDDGEYLAGFARSVAVLAEPVVVVHGGGRAIADLQARFGLPVEKVDGLRVTDAASMELVEMALSAQVNKRVVRALLAAGVDALGLSGVDGGLLRCRKKLHAGADLGYVGEICAVRAPLLQRLLAAGFVPVVSPVSLGEDDGAAYNVNADEGAMAVAAALGADQLDFISNVPGVLVQGQVVSYLSPAATLGLIADGVVLGGMIPKVRAALDALDRGVRQARIVDLPGLASDGGTCFGTEARA